MTSRIGAASGFEARAAALRVRVAQAAQALHAHGVRPTVARVRQALGGGSPNDLAPALKSWRDSVRAGPDGTPIQQGGGKGGTAMPPLVVELAREWWQSALAAATVELKHGPAARDLTARTAEAQALRDQLQGLRQQLEREALAYGELRTLAARHEVIARDALSQVHLAQARERKLLHQLGEARQREAQLRAAIPQRRAASRPRRSSRQRSGLTTGRGLKRPTPSAKPTKPPRSAPPRSRGSVATPRPSHPRHPPPTSKKRRRPPA